MYESYENRLLTLKSEGKNIAFIKSIFRAIYIFLHCDVFVALFLLILITNTAIKCIN